MVWVLYLHSVVPLAPDRLDRVVVPDVATDVPCYPQFSSWAFLSYNVSVIE